jgi:hypothetical protein
MINADERGATLLELLVSLAIVAFMFPVMVMTYAQVAKVSVGSKNYMMMIRQVQNAGYWISTDMEQADPLTINFGMIDTDFCDLAWDTRIFDVVSGAMHTVIYTVTDGTDHQSGKILTRQDTMIPVDGIAVTSSIIISTNIDISPDENELSKTRLEAVTDETGSTSGYRLFVTSTITGYQGASETRVYEFKPRPEKP